MKIEKYISNQRKFFNKELKFFFDSYRTSNILQQAMWYSLSNGGKRLRPVEIRAARYSETQLHKLVVDEIQKIISNTHVNENLSKQLGESFGQNLRGNLSKHLDVGRVQVLQGTGTWKCQ